MKAYQEPNVTIYCGHALTELPALPSESVDCVMTSPPYWGLRTYKTEPQIWGENYCEHEWITENFKQHAGRGDCQTSKKYSEQEPVPDMVLKRDFCLKCHAWRGELGLEPTIELYISHLVQIFDEVKRVLKKTGTCWVNIDDSYATHASGGKGYAHNFYAAGIAISEGIDQPKPSAISLGLQEKSLCLIPSRFALAMVEHGWIPRNDIVWYKSNPMPESVKDRFTGTWEHLFFFVKSQRYWFEQQFEPVLAASLEREKYGWNGAFKGRYTVPWEGREECKDQCYTNPLGRNKRDVWEINTEPTAQWHGIKNYATFPEKLCETPILSGCPSQICKKCGKARERIYERTGHVNKREPAHQPGNTQTKVDSTGWGPTERPTTKYTDCGCGEGWTAGVVLDPFCGSGKALSVAKRLGRKAIGIDLNPDYCKLAVKEVSKISIPMEL